MTIKNHSTIEQIRPRTVLTSADLTPEEIELGLATAERIHAALVEGGEPLTEGELDAALFQIDDNQYVRAKTATGADFNLMLRYLERKMRESESDIANLIIGDRS